ncbi:unnamed protein product, partial [Allacma fusca]
QSHSNVRIPYLAKWFYFNHVNQF